MEQQVKKPIYKRWWVWIIGIVVILIIIASGSSRPEKVGTTGEKAKQKETSMEYAIGDKIKLGNSIVSVNKVEFSQGGQFINPTEGNEWVNLNVTIENTASTQQYITTLGQMFIRDGEGNSYQVAVTNKTIENPTFGLDGTIIAKSKRTGWVGFEIKNGAQGLQFQYNGSIFGGGTVLVDLGR